MISVIVPSYNEGESLPQLLDEIREALAPTFEDFEVIVVDDGSTDDTQQILAPWTADSTTCVRVLELRRNFGRTPAIMAGVNVARGDVIVTIDADLQDVPAEIPRLLEQLDAGYDVVSGWKQNRQDPFVKRQTSKFFNSMVNRMTISKLHDHGCGLKAFRAEAIRSLNLYGGLFRFVVPLLESTGFRATEVPVQHRARRYGRSKIGASRFARGGFDFVTVLFVTRFRESPLHFFGYMGLLLAVLGGLLGVYLAIYKFVGHHAIGGRPLLFLAGVLVIVGVQITITGVIGEQINSMRLAGDRSAAVRSWSGAEED
jgi:glycosyltransferase involved in cell wall biosynthesis